MEDFVSNAHRSFDFLVKEYGFTHGGEHQPCPELGDSDKGVRYDAPHLFIWVYLDRSDVGVLFFVKVHTSVLRPNTQRAFELHEVLRLLCPDALVVLAGLDSRHEARTGFARSLQLNADLLRSHCDALLRLDLKQLELVARR